MRRHSGEHIIHSVLVKLIFITERVTSTLIRHIVLLADLIVAFSARTFSIAILLIFAFLCFLLATFVLLLIYYLPDLVIANGSIDVRVFGTYPRVDHLVSALGYGLRVPQLIVRTVSVCATHIRPIGGLLSSVDTQADTVVRHSANRVESKHGLGGGTTTKAFCASSEEGLVAF